MRRWCGAERAHFRRRRGSPTTYFFQNGSAFVAELGESSSIGTRESVRALLHCPPPFFTPCDTWSAFVCRLALRSGMKFAMSSRNLGLYEVEGRNQIFSRLSQCNLQSIPPTRGQPLGNRPFLTPSQDVVWHWNSPRYLRPVVTPITSFDASLSIHWAALTTRI